MERIRQHTRFVYKKLRKDWDGVYLIDGGEGISKSTLGLHILDQYYTQMNGKVSPDDIKHMCLEPIDFVKDLKDLKKYELTVYDEAGDLLRRRALSEFNVLIMKAYQVIRGDNLYTILIMPSVFDLDAFFAKRRVKGLFHVYRRGRVAYFSQKRLHTLVSLNQALPVKNYSLVKPTWRDWFPKYNGALDDPYAIKKKDRMKNLRNVLYEKVEADSTPLKKGVNPKKPVECLVCGHQWLPRNSNPAQCSNCRSRDWNGSAEGKIVNNLEGDKKIIVNS